MARLNVNPTRMVMSKLKGQLKVAIKGHKLMKDKRDELMRIFLELAREIKALREEVEPMLEEVYGSFSVARAVMTPEMLEEALMYPKQSVKLVAEEKNVMSIDVPSFDFEQENTQTGSVYPYGLRPHQVNSISLLRSSPFFSLNCFSLLEWRRRLCS